MRRHPEIDTREHILATGEQLCLQRGFTGMGLSELLKTAEVPKGSFYHYFRSKEAFGVAMLERYYALSLQRLQCHFAAEGYSSRDKMLAWYQASLDQYRQQGTISGCLTVKLSAEVCDLSEDMRDALNRGSARMIAILAQALEQGRREQSLDFTGEAADQAEVIYVLWLGASLQAKVSRSGAPLASALAHLQQLLQAP